MIGFLEGEVILIDEVESCVTVKLGNLENSSVGYEVFVTDLSSLAIGKVCKFWIKQIIREDTNSLYGFSEISERNIFEKLISVSGVGAKVASAILKTLKIAGVEEAIMSDDINALSKTPGLGKKGASRIILELKGKLVSAGEDENSGRAKNAATKNLPTEKLCAALESLGFRRSEIDATAKAVSAKFNGSHDLTDTELATAIKEALKELA